MTRLFIAMLILGLAAGCTSTSSLFTPNEPPTPPPAPAAVESAAPPSSQGTQQAGPRGPMTPAASAAASPGGAAPGELLECVTQSCKINCSQKVKPQFRPKWCANFKSPD